MPGSAVRGKEYIAVLSAHPRKCATGAHFVPAFLIKIKFLLQNNFKNVKGCDRIVPVGVIQIEIKRYVSMKIHNREGRKGK